jgi:predicted molibdopterin-dependent oxidoreductase YjgC
LQGVYQSNQATAAACQVNNINLVLGKIGRPGSGVFQFNGQPTAQNTRETGCDGEFPFFLNWQNPDHVRRWAELWNVDVLKLPHWHVHAHAMEMFRHAETGSLKALWVVGTNPAVSLPELHRIRKVLGMDGLFLVVSDPFRTETAEYADVVLPAAIWGEKTGTFTNTDRTVHVSYQAVEPPGEARSDLDIFLDFARRMNFQDRDGKPLIKWRDAAGAFRHWAKCSAGWLVDYGALSYEKLTGGSGIPWPCNKDFPQGRERLYTDWQFHTGADECQTYGHDLETGAARTPDEYRANDPAGRAVLKAANYIPPMEEPDGEYPFLLTTGRLVYHFHTRTKTGRCPALQEAAPEPFVQLAKGDARRLGIRAGDLIEVSSRRGTLQAKARLGDIAPGHVFVPFHYGYWDKDTEEGGHKRAANELTLTAWDPVSKQPHFKYAAVQVRKVGAAVEESIGPAIMDVASKVIDRAKELTDMVLHTKPKPRPHLADEIGLLDRSLCEFAETCRSLKAVHFEEPEIISGFETLARFSDEASARIRRLAKRYGTRGAREPESLRQAVLPAGRPGAFGLLRDLQSLKLLSTEAHTANTSVSQAAQGLRDEELMQACGFVEEVLRRQQAWLHTHLLHRSSHTLLVPS